MKSVIIVMFIMIFSISFILAISINKANKKIEKLENKQNIQSYQYIITLQDEDWIEVRHSDGSIVGQVKCDTTTQLGKLFFKDNE